MTVKHVTPEEAHRLQTSDANIVYLDVRSIPEFQQGHPSGAFNIPLLHLNASTQEMQPNPDFERTVRATFKPGQRILVGCKSGGRSLRAAQMLENLGYTDVCNVLGGFGGGEDANGNPVKGWADSGLPVSRQAEPGHDFEALKQAAT